MKWLSFLKRIPHKVQVTSRVWYEILWTPMIHKAEDCYGVMRPSEKQIVLEQGHKPKITVTTYLHELIHAYSEEYQLGLTETQVRGIEKCLYFILKEGNIFK